MLAPLALALGLAAGPPAPSPAIRLAFAWPDGAEAIRAERAEFMGVLTGERTTHEARVRVTRAEGDEVRVRIALEEEPGPGSATFPPLTVVAGPDGALRRLEGAEELRRALDAARARDAFASLVPGMREAVEKFAGSWLDAERGRWTDDVARWAGKTLAPGESVEELAAPRDARALAARVRYGLRRRLPCPGDPSRACVELWASEATDETARRAACEGKPLREGTGLVAGTRELVVIAEPDTLLPHRARWSARSREACEGSLALPGESTAHGDREYAWRRR